MMPSNKSSSLAPRSVRYAESLLDIPDESHGHLVDPVGYLRPLLPVPARVVPAKKTALVTLATCSPQLSSTNNRFAPVAPDDNGNDNDNDIASKNAKKCSSFTCRKGTPSPAFTATTEPMSDASFTSAWSDRDFRSATSPFSASATISESRFTINRRIPTPMPMKSPDASKKFLKAAASLQTTRADEDFARKSRIKTEFCLHYQAGDPAKCPFGASCTFAHSIEELQKTKLVDLERTGLIDSAQTYRTKPCFLYVSTGSCPFGKRCAFLHDQRSSGMDASWLPVTETQGNTIPTDINVESSHQKRLFAILHDNPFGNNFSLDHDDADHLYQLVANMKEDGRRRVLLDMHKVSIAIQMQSTWGWSYKFRPQHIIHGELCMQLQKRAFRLNNAGQAFEIPKDSFDARSPANVLVREIAFGPDCDPSVPNVGLYFNVLDDDVALCTPQQAKRFRWKRGLHNKNKSDNTDRGSRSSTIFDFIECFAMYRPCDSDAFDLCTQILQHRLAVLQSKQNAGHALLDYRSTLDLRLKEILNLIRGQIESWKRWSWPINEGRDRVDEDTCVPAVDGYYYQDTVSMTLKSPTRATTKIWESFVSRGSSDPATPQPRNRLPLFLQLARGEGISLNRNIPHLQKKKFKSSSTSSPVNETGERCWRSLLLAPLPGEPNEWDLVREHFEKSRSKKVLKILQQ